MKRLADGESLKMALALAEKEPQLKRTANRKAMPFSV